MQCPRCRAAVPAGSLFCNGCGLPMQAPGGQPSASQPQAAAQPQAWQQAPPQPGPYAQPGPAPGFDRTIQEASQLGPHPGVPFDPPAPTRKPIALLAALVALVAVAAVGGSALLLSRRNGAVVSSAAARVPNGPGVTQSANANLPAGQGVVASPTGVTPAGQPVTAGPKRVDDGAPPLLMAPGANVPGGSSVTTVHGPAIPDGPPMTAAPTRPVRPGQPVTAQPAPPAPPSDDQEVDTYLKWLRTVEFHRSRLKADADTRQANLTSGMLSSMIDAMSDPGPEGDQKLQQIPQQAQAEFVQMLKVQNAFWNTALRSKPRVPNRCISLDRFYMSAADLQFRLSQDLANAMQRRDYGGVMKVSGQTQLVYDNLKKADSELSRILDEKQWPRDWMIQSGGGSGSGLGGLLGGM